MRVPDLSAFEREPVRAPMLADAVAAYRTSRIDIAEATRVNIGTSLNLIVGALDGARPVDAFAPHEIADAVTRLHASGYKRETLRKAITHLACVFDSSRSTPIPSATDCAYASLGARSASRSRRAPSMSKRCTGCCRRNIGSPCSGSTGRVHGSLASTRRQSAITTSPAVVSACVPLSPRLGVPYR